MHPARPGAPTITHGVIVGDVTVSSALLWARSDREATLNVALSGGRHGPIAQAAARAADDFTARVPIEHLAPERTYRYRAWFSDGSPGAGHGPAVTDRSPDHRLRARAARHPRLHACPRDPQQHLDHDRPLRRGVPVRAVPGRSRVRRVRARHGADERRHLPDDRLRPDTAPGAPRSLRASVRGRGHSWSQAKQWFNFGVLDVGADGRLTMRSVNTAGETEFERTLTPS